MRSPRELAYPRSLANDFADSFLRDRYITLELRLVTSQNASTQSPVMSRSCASEPLPSGIMLRIALYPA
jgi:hypothetical protein